MTIENIKIFLETMCEFNTTNISQVFSAEDGHSLSIRCLPGTRTFELSNSQTREIIQNDSIEETAQYVLAFITFDSSSINS